MLNSRQRASLRRCANKIDTILQVGKSGIGDTLIKQINDALTAREIIKIKVLENCEYSAREVSQILEEKTRCESVQVIGCKVVLFRRNPEAPHYDEYLK